VIRLPVASVCVGFDCTTEKSEIYFCMFIPTGMSNIRVIISCDSANKLVLLLSLLLLLLLLLFNLFNIVFTVHLVYIKKEPTRCTITIKNFNSSITLNPTCFGQVPDNLQGFYIWI
jgi:hypothetical protein